MVGGKEVVEEVDVVARPRAEGAAAAQLEAERPSEAVAGPARAREGEVDVARASTFSPICAIASTS
ncbi:MAG: hypothetical protein RLP09_03850 [Sandaracinaceae bacterium]